MERRAGVENLVDSECSCPDQLTVQVAGARAMLASLEKAGPRVVCKPGESASGGVQSLVQLCNGRRFLLEHQLTKEDRRLWHHEDPPAIASAPRLTHCSVPTASSRACSRRSAGSRPDQAHGDRCAGRHVPVCAVYALNAS